MLADARAALDAIGQALPKAGSRGARQRNAERIKAYIAAEPAADDDLRRDLRQVLAVIREALPADTIVASDMTQMRLCRERDLSGGSARQWLHPAGFGTLGYALSRRHRGEGRSP